MKSRLKIRYLERSINRCLINESTINKDLLNRYSDAINTIERLNDLLGIVHMNALREITLDLTVELQNELEKATDFHGKKGKLGGFIRSWLGKYYKHGALKKLSTIIDGLKLGIQQSIEFIDASLSKDHITDGSIKDLIIYASTGLDEKKLHKIITNAFDFNNRYWNNTINDIANAILNLPYESLKDLKNSIDHIDDKIDNINNSIESNITSISTSANQNQSLNNQDKNSENNIPDSKSLAKSLAQLDPKKVDAIIRSANRLRRKINK